MSGGETRGWKSTNLQGEIRMRAFHVDVNADDGVFSGGGCVVASNTAQHAAGGKARHEGEEAHGGDGGWHTMRTVASLSY